MKIVVLSITQYKEKDAIISAISEDGDITFLARGVFDPKNKNAAINNLLSIADIELSDGNYKYPVLKTANVSLNPMRLNNDLEYLSSLMLVAEATKSLLQEEEKGRIFETLVSAGIALKKAKEPWFILLVYFANLFKIGGYEFEVNRCVFCGSKQNIVTFSFADGGFVCQNCMNLETERNLSKEQMLLLRAAFNCQDIANNEYQYQKEDAKVVLNKFFEFIYDSYGIKFKSAALIK